MCVTGCVNVLKNLKSGILCKLSLNKYFPFNPYFHFLEEISVYNSTLAFKFSSSLYYESNSTFNIAVYADDTTLYSKC